MPLFIQLNTPSVLFGIEPLLVIGKRLGIAPGPATLVSIIFRRRRRLGLHFCSGLYLRAEMQRVIEGDNPAARLLRFRLIEVGEQSRDLFRAHADSSCLIHCLLIAPRCFSSSWMICSSLFCGACWAFREMSCTRLGVSSKAN